MKKLKGIICAAVFAVMAGCLAGCTYTTSYIYDNGEKYTAGDREISDKIESINIHYESGELKLEETSSDKISIKETSNKQLNDKQKVHTWVDGTKLYVRYAASARRIDMSNLDKSLVISLPESIDLDDVKIEVSSGDVTADGFTANNVDIESSSGSMDVKCEAKKLRLEASSGNIKLTQTGESDSVSLKASSGEIDVDLDTVKALDGVTSSGSFTAHLKSIPETTDVEASSGEVKIYIPEKSDITAILEHSSGEVSYDIPFEKDGDKYVCGNGINKMNVETSSGDITINKY